MGKDPKFVWKMVDRNNFKDFGITNFNTTDPKFTADPKK